MNLSSFGDAARAAQEEAVQALQQTVATFVRATGMPSLVMQAIGCRTVACQCGRCLGFRVEPTSVMHVLSSGQPEFLPRSRFERSAAPAPTSGTVDLQVPGVTSEDSP